MAALIDGLLCYNTTLVWTGARRSLCEFMISKWLFMAAKGYLADGCFHCGGQIPPFITASFTCFIYCIVWWLSAWRPFAVIGFLLVMFCQEFISEVWVLIKRCYTLKNHDNKGSRVCSLKKKKEILTHELKVTSTGRLYSERSPMVHINIWFLYLWSSIFVYI